MPGYCDEKGVSPSSKTETFVALKLAIDNWRWAGVPFYLRSGKRLAKRISEIAIQFKQPPFRLFRGTGIDQIQPNVLSLRIQPNEGISLFFDAKVPGQEMQIRGVNMDFLYGSSFGVEPPEAYERLLLDAMKGDATLYARGDWVDLAWGLLEPVIERWAVADAKFPNYEAGTWGPAEADTLIERSGRRWRRP